MQIIRKMMDKLFFESSYFTIALRPSTNDPLCLSSGFSPSYVMSASSKSWFADPILVDHGGKTFLFYEAVEGMHGHLEVREIYGDCSLSSPVVILKSKEHYSYPFVFQMDGEWFMIPESSSQDIITLYRASHFPEKWVPLQNLLSGHYVDTTVFEYKKSHYVLTFLADIESEKVVPFVFLLRREANRFTLEKINWDHYNPLCVRGAGGIFSMSEALLRPVQISSLHSYGDALAFAKLTINQACYYEQVISTLRPEQVYTHQKHITGLHTYSCSAKYEAIDIRCRDFNLFKPIKRLIHRLLL